MTALQSIVDAIVGKLGGARVHGRTTVVAVELGVSAARRTWSSVAIMVDVATRVASVADTVAARVELLGIRDARTVVVPARVAVAIRVG